MYNLKRHRMKTAQGTWHWQKKPQERRLEILCTIEHVEEDPNVDMS